MIAIEAKAKHGIMFRYMRDNGLTAKELATQIGISGSTLGKFLNLKKYPKTEYFKSKKTLKKLCKFFKCGPKDLFPKEITRHLDQQTEIADILQNKQVIYKEPSLEYLADYTDLANDLISYEQPEYDRVGLKEAIKVSLKTLSEREKTVIKKHIIEERTLGEVAGELGITQERVRQIEAKALRKLRHPTRGKKLAQYVGSQ
jgi:RNA polymerase sigma factor (sigma-70 family)